MGRTPRERSNADIYHVFARGVGRQCIFEDEEDHERFLEMLVQKADACDAKILAWCLMGNHFHLLVKAKLDDLSSLMKRLEVAYAQHFNDRYDRVGCLFQGRFSSEPIADESQLLAAVRYVHANPQKAGIARFDTYRWSSYSEYVDKRSIIDPALVLDITGSVKGFIELHRVQDVEREFMDESSYDGKPKRRHPPDSEVREELTSKLGKSWRTKLPALPKQQRDAVLKEMKAQGASIRQLERITGIGRGIVLKA